MSASVYVTRIAMQLPLRVKGCSGGDRIWSVPYVDNGLCTDIQIASIVSAILHKGEAPPINLKTDNIGNS